jgi:O-methyltransferase
MREFMDVVDTRFADLKIIRPRRHGDERGTFMEAYSNHRYTEFGIDTEFVQDNYALSHKKGTVCGLHFQKPHHAQAKLVWVVRGSVGSDWPFMNAQTMIGLERLDNIQRLAEDALSRGVEGDLIETGVWRGGACIFMRAILKAHNIQDRRVWACDSFEGLPTPDTERSPADKGTGFHQLNFLAVSQKEVTANFKKYNLLDDQVTFVKGYFEDNLADIPIEKLALMRLDGDQYGSTITALENLYPKLSSSGYVIVDDFHLDCCRSAVNDYRSTHNITDEIINIDGLGAYWQKT